MDEDAPPPEEDTTTETRLDPRFPYEVESFDPDFFDNAAP